MDVQPLITVGRIGHPTVESLVIEVCAPSVWGRRGWIRMDRTQLPGGDCVPPLRLDLDSAQCRMVAAALIAAADDLDGR